MKKITLSANEELIKRAQAKARKNKTTLTKEFRKWLEEYAVEDATPVKASRKKKAQGSPLSRLGTALKNFEKKLEEKL